LEKARMSGLYWLPECEDWRARLRALAAGDPAPGSAPAAAWAEAVALANARLDFVRTNALDQIVARRFGPPGVETGPPPGLAAGLAAKPVRLALLGSGTMAHLHAAIRVAGLRRGLWITVYENDYGQYWQELSDPGSALHAFRPNVVLFALDPYHLTAGLGAAAGAAEAAERAAEWQDRLRQCWSLAKEAFRCPVLHQTALPVHPALLGNNEHRLPGSPADFILRFNRELRALADAEGVDVVALDAQMARDGIRAWHDPALWHRAKQNRPCGTAPSRRCRRPRRRCMASWWRALSRRGRGARPNAW
jgi:hypothetical protein